MIKAVYSEADQARIDSANEDVEDLTKLIMSKAKSMGLTSYNTMRMVADDKERALMLRDITSMVATMVPSYTVKHWR